MEPRTYKGKVGYHKITPLKKNNKFFLINRGFVEKKVDENINYENYSTRGIIIKIPEKKFLALENNTQNNKWYNLDVSDFSKFYNMNVVPYVIYEKNNQEKNFKPVMPNIVSKVNHLHYAITWFLLAMSLCIIFILSLREKNE